MGLFLRKHWELIVVLLGSGLAVIIYWQPDIVLSKADAVATEMSFWLDVFIAWLIGTLVVWTIAAALRRWLSPRTAWFVGIVLHMFVILLPLWLWVESERGLLSPAWSMLIFLYALVLHMFLWVYGLRWFSEDSPSADIDNDQTAVSS